MCRIMKKDKRTEIVVKSNEVIQCDEAQWKNKWIM